MVYATVMVLLAVINMLTSHGPTLFIWPSIGWGLAHSRHGTRVFPLADRNANVDALTKYELRHSGADKCNESMQRKVPAQ